MRSLFVDGVFVKQCVEQTSFKRPISSCVCSTASSPCKSPDLFVDAISEHARRRTVNFVLGMITLVWLVSCLICLPPLIGWNDWPDVWTDETPCRLTEEPGYIVYSSMGSFYIPLGIIMFVYFKIFQV